MTKNHIAGRHTYAKANVAKIMSNEMTVNFVRIIGLSESRSQLYIVNMRGV